jgi:hypothetical protein
MADLSSLFAAVEQRAVEIVEATVGELSHELDRVVPRSGDNAGETLSETKEVEPVVSDGTVVRSAISYTASYAEATDEGEGDWYAITPVNANYLRFEGTNDWEGQIIYTNFVWHPPQKGTRWFSDTVQGDVWVDGP